MHQGDPEPTAADLISAAKGWGEAVSRNQLRDWRLAGLLPRPRKISQGRGRGFTSVYPAGTTGQLEALLEARRIRRRYEWIRWALWWQGFPVDPERVREVLIEFAAENARRGEEIAASERDLDSDDDPWVEVEASAPKKPRTRWLKLLRQQIGGSGIADLLIALRKLSAGVAPDLSDDFAAALNEATGDAAADVQLEAVAAMSDASRQLDALLAATTQELCEARDEVRQMLAEIGFVGSALADRWNPIARFFFEDVTGNPHPREIDGYLLLWLAARESQEWRQLYSSSLTVLRLLRLGIMQPEDVELQE